MKTKFRTGIAMLGALALFAAGCGSDSDSGSDSGSGGQIKVGFAQTGSESGWRSANTESMKEAFSKDNGFDLVFNAADNDPAAQISAVRSFISQGVDAIVIAPIVEDGWDDVLQEAKDADIPVILEDRTVTSSDDLYASWVGLDFKKEGVTAGEWAAENFTEPTKMVVLEGTTGSAPANDRAEGFTEGIGDAPIETIDSQTGDFTRDGGKTVMEGFLQKYGVDGIDLRVRPQRRHGARVPSRRSRPPAARRARTSRSCRSTRSRTACRRSSTARSTSSSSATRCWVSRRPTW